MTENPEFLKVNEDRIVNESGEEVRLRGFCLGSWLNLEAFMVGFPGTESEFRAAVTETLGRELGEYFFQRFLHYFAGQADFDYIKNLGCNLVRVAFNYHHFEDNDQPFKYKSGGFEWLDKAIGWAKYAGVYISLDFHAYPGWQSRGWHCDNPGGPPQFWNHIHFQERGISLWEQIADRYKDEPAVAMYGVMNEPEAQDAGKLNQYYRKVSQAIRSIDDRHILNFEGNFYSSDFSQLEPPPDDNAVYSSHLYVEAGLDDVTCPGQAGDDYFDASTLKEEYEQRRSYCAEHNIPHYFSEFGVIYNDPALFKSKLQVMEDFLEIIESYGDHWTIWNYKDIGKMGIVTVDPESPWMERIKPVHEIKTELRADSWVDRTSPELDTRLRSLEDYYQTRLQNLGGNQIFPREELGYMVGDRFVARLLMPAFAELFSKMSAAEIDALMASFAFENCNRREGLEDLIIKFTQKEQE